MLHFLVLFTAHTASASMPNLEEIQALSPAPAATHRTISQAAQPDDQNLSPKFRAFRDSYLKLTTAAGVDAFLKSADTLVKSSEPLPPDVQLAATLAAGALPFRGLAYRLSDDAIWHDFHAAHSGALTVVKDLAAANRALFGFNDTDTAPEKAAFDWITEPAAGQLKAERFHSEAELQAFLCDKAGFFGGLEKSGERLYNILRAWNTAKDDTFSKNNRWIVWDNKIASSQRLFSGTQSAAGTQSHRYVYVGKAELTSLLSATSSGMAQLSMYCAYDFADALSVSKKLGMSLGMDGLSNAFRIGGFLGVGSDIEYGLTARERIRILKSFPKFLHLRDASRMADALRYFQLSVEFSKFSLSTVMTGDDMNDHQVLRKSRIAPYQVDLERSRKMAANLLSQDTVAIAGATDFDSTQVSRVSLKRFFTSAPQDLKDFLPDPSDDASFDHASYWLNKDLEAKNYQFDRVLKWNFAALKPYLPDADEKEGPAPLLRALRIVSQGAVVSQ